MNHLIINGFDFGVDGERSSLATYDCTFVLKLVGDEDVIGSIMEDDEHPWGWLIQPPFLYAIGLPCQFDANGDFVHDITEQDLDDHDVALYYHLNLADNGKSKMLDVRYTTVAGTSKHEQHFDDGLECARCVRRSHGRTANRGRIDQGVLCRGRREDSAIEDADPLQVPLS